MGPDRIGGAVEVQPLGQFHLWDEDENHCGFALEPALLGRVGIGQRIGWATKFLQPLVDQQRGTFGLIDEGQAFSGAAFLTQRRDALVADAFFPGLGGRGGKVEAELGPDQCGAIKGIDHL